MRIIFQLLCCGIMYCAFHGTGSAQEERDVSPEPDRMKVLFNGVNLDGWDGDPRLWSVREGVIHGETTETNKAKGNTFLVWTGGETRDFDLRLSFRCNATNNSGIQYRSKHIRDGNPANAWVVRGYQHEIRNENVFPDVPSFVYDEGGSRGRLCLTGEKAIWEDGQKKTLATLIDQTGFKKLMRIDDWNDVVIQAQGNRIRHFLNGQLVLDFEDRDQKLALKAGVLALQLHAGAPMWVEFRNIRMIDLPSK
jgi:Domain of Unknown Function (DUF1080)